MAVEIGLTLKGVVEEIKPFGAFIKLETGDRGLIHVSEITHAFVQNVSDYLHVNDEINVKVIAKKDGGKIDLSMKALEAPREQQPPRSFGGGRGRSRGSSDDSGPVSDDMKSFEEKLSVLMKESSERLSELKRHNDMRKKRGRSRR